MSPEQLWQAGGKNLEWNVSKQAMPSRLPWDVVLCWSINDALNLAKSWLPALFAICPDGALQTHRSTKNELNWILSNYFRTDSHVAWLCCRCAVSKACRDEQVSAAQRLLGTRFVVPPPPPPLPAPPPEVCAQRSGLPPEVCAQRSGLGS